MTTLEKIALTGVILGVLMGLILSALGIDRIGTYIRFGCVIGFLNVVAWIIIEGRSRK